MRAQRLAGSFVNKFRQLLCGVRTNHIDYPIYGYGHLTTQCMNCGHVRKGWTWDVKTVRRMTR